jgi:hypothetical protein
VTTLDDVRARALRSLIPPPRLRLAQRIEANIVLPEGVSALPGRVQLWPYQRSFHCDYAAPPALPSASSRSSASSRVDGRSSVLGGFGLAGLFGVKS